MRLRPDVIEILACPRCHGQLVFMSDESAFECRQCRLAYPVRDAIPDFLVDHALPLDGATAGGGGRGGGGGGGGGGR